MSADANHFEVYNHHYYNNNTDCDPLLVDCDSILDEKLRPSIFYDSNLPQNDVDYPFNNGKIGNLNGKSSVEPSFPFLEASFDNCVTSLEDFRNFERSDENRFSDCFDDENADLTETNVTPRLTHVTGEKRGNFNSKVHIIRVIKRRTQSASLVDGNNNTTTATALHDIEYKRSFSDCPTNIDDNLLRKWREHRMKREKNNASVKRCREKKRLESLEIAARVKSLTAELTLRNEQIKKLMFEIEELKRENQKFKNEYRLLSHMPFDEKTMSVDQDLLLY
uniref:BZIP domain-containing protein n=1 Tax=Romanomermis culicivorax TaxID=13658 RepID=A0A915IM11_ROMCU